MLLHGCWMVVQQGVQSFATLDGAWRTRSTPHPHPLAMCGAACLCRTVLMPKPQPTVCAYLHVCRFLPRRLVTCEADKTIKMWREDANATEETHPVNFKPPKDIKRF